MGHTLRLEFLISADALAKLPPTTAEVAVIGRSNVGKSSLVNALANDKHMAHTSKTPGRTRLLNCFRVDNGPTLVDLPGYGYASASKTMRAGFQRMSQEYLLGRDELTMVMVLVDGEIGPTPLDAGMLEWLRENGLPHQVIATKHDKVKASKRERRKRDLAAGCDLLPADIVWVSAAKGTGIDRLRGLVRLWLSLDGVS